MLLCLSLAELLHSQTHIPRGPSGNVSKMAVGTGAGTVGIGVGTTETTIANHIKLYSEYTHSLTKTTLWYSLWGGKWQQRRPGR